MLKRSSFQRSGLKGQTFILKVSLCFQYSHYRARKSSEDTQADWDRLVYIFVQNFHKRNYVTLYFRLEETIKANVKEEDSEAWQIQRLLGKGGLERIAGVDISFIKNDAVNACACVVVLSLPELHVSHLTSDNFICLT